MYSSRNNLKLTGPYLVSMRYLIQFIISCENGMIHATKTNLINNTWKNTFAKIMKGRINIYQVQYKNTC